MLVYASFLAMVVSVEFYGKPPSWLSTVCVFVGVLAITIANEKYNELKERIKILENKYTKEGVGE
jgi:hypothetical protein